MRTLRKRRCWPGLGTERDPWVAALVAAGYTVFAINPVQLARSRQRHSVSGAKSDAADAHTLAEVVRTDSHQLRPVAADTPQAEAVKVVTRAHKTLIFRTDPPHPAAAARAARVLPAPRWRRLRTWMPPMSWSCWPRHRTRLRRRG